MEMRRIRMGMKRTMDRETTVTLPVVITTKEEMMTTQQMVGKKGR